MVLALVKITTADLIPGITAFKASSRETARIPDDTQLPADDDQAQVRFHHLM